MIPNQGWLPNALNGPITQYVLPEVYKIRYFVCASDGPFDAARPWEQPIIVQDIAINQGFSVGAGYKGKNWGWFVGIDWTFAYGDALIDSIWPPLAPGFESETCPGNPDYADEDVAMMLVANDDACGVLVMSDDEACPNSLNGDECDP